MIENSQGCISSSYFHMKLVLDLDNLSQMPLEDLEDQIRSLESEAYPDP